MRSIYLHAVSDTIRSWLTPALKAEGWAVRSEMTSADTLLLGTEPMTPLEEDALLVFCRAHPKTKILMLSSARVYGEGDFHCGDCGPIVDPGRNIEHFKTRRWEVLCPICGEMLMPEPIRENSKSCAHEPGGQAIRALEQWMLDVLVPLDCPVVILRLFAPYAPYFYLAERGHALMVYRFTQKLLSGEPFRIYEDGCQMRDLTYGEDVVQAIVKTMACELPSGTVMNIGSGTRLLVQQVAAYLQEFLRCETVPYSLSEDYRPGDVRHRLADISLARRLIGYEPRFSVLDGLKAFSSGMLE